MINETPHEFEICWFLRGADQSSSVFAVQIPDDAKYVHYVSVGCDDDGVFLLTDDGTKSRINNPEGIECYDETEGHSALRLLILNRYGEHDDEYDISRIPREQTMTLGA